MAKENNFTTNELALEYITLKIENGYEPEFTIDEFRDLLTFLKQRLRDKVNDENGIIIDTSHLTLVGKTIKANYLLTSYESDMIDSKSPNSLEVKEAIKEYLKGIPKQKITINQHISEIKLMKGRLVAAKMISYIWRDHIHVLTQKQQWPKQCYDIKTYLLESDLAPSIGLPSIKTETLDFYDAVSKRIATLYSTDHNLKITSINGSLLAYSNYLRLIKDYEAFVGKSFDISYIPYHNKKRLLSVDLRQNLFKEIHDIDGIDIYLGEDMEHVSKAIDDPKTKQLVYSLGQVRRG